METVEQATAEETNSGEVSPPGPVFNEQDEERVQAAAESQRELVQELRRAVNEDPRNVELLVDLGKAAETTGDLDRARWAYRRAIRLDPGWGTAYLYLGRMYGQEGRTKPAVHALQNCLNYSTDDVERKEALADLKSMLGNDSDATTGSNFDAPERSALEEAWQDLDLTPAEALFLADPENSSGRQMMRYTLLDLAIRGILDMTDSDQVGRGDQYEESNLRPHEALFAKYFSRFDDYVEADRLSRAALSELDNRYDLFKQRYVFLSLVDKGYLEMETHRVWGLLPVKRYKLTDKGIRAQHKAKRLLKRTDDRISRSLKANPEGAKAYVSSGGPSILLIEEYPEGYFQEMQDKLESMGFGPTVNRLRDQARSSDQGTAFDRILKTILGE